MGINWSAGLRGMSEGIDGMTKVNQQKTEILYKQLSEQNLQRFREKQAREEQEWRSAESQAARDFRSKESELDRESREGIAEQNRKTQEARIQADDEYRTATLEERGRHNRATEEYNQSESIRRRQDDVRERYIDDINRIEDQLADPLTKATLPPEEIKAMEARRDELRSTMNRETFRAGLGDDVVKDYDKAYRRMRKLAKGSDYAMEYGRMDEAGRQAVDGIYEQLKDGGMKEDEAMATAIWRAQNGDGTMPAPQNTGETEEFIPAPGGEAQGEAGEKPDYGAMSPDEANARLREMGGTPETDDTLPPEQAFIPPGMGAADGRGFGQAQQPDVANPALTPAAPQQAPAQVAEAPDPAAQAQPTGQPAPSPDPQQQQPRMMQAGGDGDLVGELTAKHGPSLEQAAMGGMRMRPAALKKVFKDVPDEGTMSALLDAQRIFEPEQKEKIMEMYRKHAKQRSA